MYIFINEQEIYTYDPSRTAFWKIHALKYGDWTPNGTYVKFIEFPTSEVRLIVLMGASRDVIDRM